MTKDHTARTIRPEELAAAMQQDEAKIITMAVDELLAFAAREPVVAAPDTAEQTAADYFTQNPDCRIRVAPDE